MDAYAISVSARTVGEPRSTEDFLLGLPLTIPATKEAKAEIAKLRDRIASDKSATLEEARKSLWNNLSSLYAIQPPSPEEKWGCKAGASARDAKNPDTEPVLLSNLAAKELVLEAKRYYWSQRIPLFGSTQGSIKLGDDGTLSEGTTNVQDDTAKTLLSVFPATALLSKAFGVAGSAAATGTTATSVELKAFSARTDEKSKSKSFQVVVSVIPKASIYTVKRACEFGTNDSKCLSLEPIRIATALCAHDAQLVSVLPVSESAETDETPAYEVSGRIVPPKSAK